jgi:ABC-type uncharacterized transport system involved in gliding motility auxiliary subunit
MKAHTAGDRHRGSRYFRFLLYLVAVVLLNAAGSTLFVRADLTANGVYSLSDASRRVVSSLSEPLTVKVFFSTDLPAPYNNIERYIHDMLEEYSVAGNRYFNYQFYDVSGGEDDEETLGNREMARDYGISSVQIQNIEQDEVKFQKAYMGMALMHGDIIETLPAITSTEGLEFRITSAIRKMSNKISALLGMQEDISVKLFLSSSLQVVGPYIDIAGISEIPAKLGGVVEELNEKNYDRLAFQHLDPTADPAYEEEARLRDILSLKWDMFSDRRGKVVPADKGYAGLVVGHGDRAEVIQLLRVVRLPFFGTQYQLAEMDEIRAAINRAVENVVNINEETGYLADHGTLKLGPAGQMPGLAREEALYNFQGMLSDQYSVREVKLSDEGMPEGLPSLIIAGAKEEFTEYELYQIDQFLMKGRSLAIFMDSHAEHMPQARQPMMFGQQQQPVYRPVSTGLEKLLSHYGLSVRESYVLDENCFKQRVSRAYGGGEQPVYFAPIIKNESIEKDVGFLRNIKGLVMLKASPVDADGERIEKSGLTATRLFSSSGRAWEMSGKIQFNPVFIRPPDNDDDYVQLPMAYLVEGPFKSYFADRHVPFREAGGKEAAGAEGKKPPPGAAHVESTDTIKKGRPGKIFLIGTSEILKDNIVDEAGQSPNAQFVMNVIDYLNGMEDYAVMRSKTQRFNPLKEVKPGTRAAVKAFNIAGLPALVVLAGVAVWVRRKARKRMINQVFKGF